MAKRKIHTLLAALVIVIGLVLMTGKIVADSEPGLIPFVLVVVGLAWLLVARVRL